MNDSSLKIMNKSFNILDKRRAALLQDERTINLKERVKKIRSNAVDHLSALLEKAQDNLQNNGIEVIMAKDANEARQAIYQLVKDEDTIAKSKSNTAGEIKLTEYLESKDVKVLETDLGDRIVQFDESHPTHPIGPACHLNMEKIAEIVSNNLQKDVEAEPRAILDSVKKDIIEKISNIK